MIAAMIAAIKRYFLFDCRGASIRSEVGGGGVGLCGVCRRPARPALAVHGLSASVALNIHLEDCGVVEETVDGGERHCGIGEDLSPFAKRLVGGDQHGAPLVLGADQFELGGSLCVIFRLWHA